jgi:hypothetical protein
VCGGHLVNLIQPGFVFLLLGVVISGLLPIATFVMLVLTFRRTASIERKLDRLLGGGSSPR